MLKLFFKTILNLTLPTGTVAKELCKARLPAGRNAGEKAILSGRCLEWVRDMKVITRCIITVSLIR